MDVLEYKMMLTHDGGTLIVKTVARSIEAAEDIIQKAELCPKRAMRLLEITKRRV